MGSLVKYVALGGFACLGMATLYKQQLNGKIKNASYFKDAMSLLHEHKASDVYLGKPIFSKQVDVFSKHNYADAKVARMYVPVRGSKCKGELFFSANKDDEGKKWVVNRVELEIKDEHGGTVLIFDNGKSESLNSSEIIFE